MPIKSEFLPSAPLISKRNSSGSIFVLCAFLLFGSCKLPTIDPTLEACFKIEIPCSGFAPLKVRVENCSQGAESFEWQWAGDSVTTQADPGSLLFPKGGNYTIKLVARDANGNEVEFLDTLALAELNAFEKRLNPNTQILDPRKIIQTRAGGYAITGAIQEGFGSRKDAFFVQLNPDGTLNGDFKVWGEALENKIGIDIVQRTDGSFVLLASTRKAEVYHLTEQGVLVSAPYLIGDKESDRPFDMIATPDGGVAFCGKKITGTNEVYGWFVKLAADFSIEADMTFGPEGNFFEGISATMEGGYAFVGKKPIDSVTAELWFYRISPDFQQRVSALNQILNVFYNPEHVTPGSILNTGEDKFLLSVTFLGVNKAKAWVIPVDLNGQVGSYLLQGYGIFNSAGGESVVDMIPTSDGGYALTGTTWSGKFGQRDIWLLKLDPELQEEWQDSFGTTSEEFGYSVIESHDDCGVLVIGSHSIPPDQADLWIAKTPGIR